MEDTNAQRDYQARKRAQGLCGQCGVNPASCSQCHECRDRNTRRARLRRGLRPWRPGGQGRPPAAVLGEKLQSEGHGEAVANPGERA